MPGATSDRRHVISYLPIRRHHWILPPKPTLSLNVTVNEHRALINLHLFFFKIHLSKAWMSCSLGMASAALGRCQTKTMRTAMPLQQDTTVNGPITFNCCPKDDLRVILL